MDDRRTTWIFFGVIALAVLALAGWGRFNYQMAKQGVMSEELVVNWVAARTVVVDGKSPYQSDVTHAILTVLGGGSVPVVGHVPQFTSPIYVIFLLLPFAFINDLSTVQAIWTTLQQLVLVALILLSVNLSPAKPSRLVFGLLAGTTFLGFYAVAPIFYGSTVLLATLFLLLALWSIQSGRNELGGALLALTTIQLPYMILPLTLILLWSLRQRKQLVVMWCLGIVVLLTVLGIFVISEWPRQYLGILYRYTLYYPASSPGAAFRAWWPGIGALMSWVLTIITALVLCVEWWGTLRGEFRQLLWVTALTLAIGMWTGLPALPRNLILLILPLVMSVSAWSERWGVIGNAIAVVSLVTVLVWEWWLVRENMGSLLQADSLKLLIPLPIICIIGLYWVRGIIVNPKHLLINELRSRENG